MKPVSLVEIMEKASAGAYGEESAYIGKLAGLFNAAAFDQGWGPFICGADGDPGTDGLHESYSICPCYGADFQNTGHYVKANEIKALRAHIAVLEIANAAYRKERDELLAIKENTE